MPVRTLPGAVGICARTGKELVREMVEADLELIKREGIRQHRD